MDTPVGRGSADMIDALVALDEALQRGPLPLDVPEVEGPRQARSEMLDQIRDYLLPRLNAIDAPLLVVVGGSTGVGKSTLVSSLVGERVTEPGLLRPTTRSPVLVHHPDDGEWFATDRIFPRLMRSLAPTTDAEAIQLAATASIPAGLALIDAPDFDSVEAANRTLATELLAAADLWLFVTSAARYADGVPWDHLRTAVERGTVVAVVLDRVPERGSDTVRRHLRSLMQTRGLRDSPLFVIHESTLNAGMLPEDALSEVRVWLGTVADDPTAKRTILDQTLDGAIRALARRSYGLAEPLEAQASAFTRLHDELDAAYEKALESLLAGLTDGSQLRGETLLRWQEYVGTDEFLKGLDAKSGSLRSRLLDWARGRAPQADEVAKAIGRGLQTAVVESAEAAAAEVVEAWSGSDAGRSVLVEEATLERAASWLRGAVEETAKAWQDQLVASLRDELGQAEAASPIDLEADPISVALMVAALGEGGAAEVGEKLLDAVFGEHDAKDMTDGARVDLRARVARVIGDDRSRFHEVLEGLGFSPDAAAQLKAASARLDDVRFTSQLKVGPWL